MSCFGDKIITHMLHLDPWPRSQCLDLMDTAKLLQAMLVAALAWAATRGGSVIMECGESSTLQKIAGLVG